jgi:hypothetical protein
MRARPSLAKRVTRAAREIRDADAALRSGAAPLMSQLCKVGPGQIELDSKRLGSYPVGFRRTVLRMLWSRGAPRAEGLTHHHLCSLLRLLRKGKGGARVMLPGGWCAERDHASIRFRKARPGAVPGRVALEVPGRARWGEKVLRGRWTSGAGVIARPHAEDGREEYFAAEGIEGTLELRAGRADERFVPFGRQDPIRLGEFLKRQRVSRDQQFGPGVLADAGGILWVIGVRRSARAPVTPTTRRVLWVQAE